MHRVYVDAVINHMTPRDKVGIADGGSTYDGNIQDYPGVPYTKENFTPRELCPSVDGKVAVSKLFLRRNVYLTRQYFCISLAIGTVDDYQDENNVRNCYLLGLSDLYTAQEYVRSAIAGYLNRLIQIGVAGIRIDAAKHMWPEVCIRSRLQCSLNGGCVVNELI